jgi:DNA repair exonuclease SbcCD ATPase subunit
MNVIPSNSNPTEQDSKGTDPKGQDPTSKGQDPNEKPPLSREALEAIVAELREENAKNRVKLQKHTDEQKKQAAEAQASEEARLKEQNQFKELAEKYGAKVQELEPTVERYTALSGLLDGQIKEQVKDWPKEVKDLLPDDSVSIEDRYAQVQKLQAFVDKLQAQPQTKPGHAPNPKPATQTPEGYAKKMEKQLIDSGKYRA